jgi:hypothetical protein
MATYTRVSGDYNIVSIDPTVDNVNITTSSLNVTGNLNVAGNITYITVESFTVDDPFITIAGNNSGTLGTAPYQEQGIVTRTSGSTYAGLRFDNGTQEWQISDDVYANGAPVTSYVAISTYTDADVAAYLPTYTGNISAGNVSITGNLLAGNLNSNAAVTGTTGIFSGNISAGNLNSSAAVTGITGVFSGNVTGNLFVGNGSQLTGIFVSSLINGTSNVSTASNGNVIINIAGNAAIATFTGTGANISGTLNATGNISAGNLDAINLVINSISSDDSTFVTIEDGLNVNGEISATGNITGDFLMGNGSQLTGLYGPAFIATQTSYQNLQSSPSSISSLSLIYDNIIANTNSGYNATTGIFTASTAGYYQVSGSIGINILGNTSANGAGALVMYYNGNTYAAGPFTQPFEAISGNSTTTVVSQSSLSTLVYLNNNDTVQLKLGYITNAVANQWTTETNLVPSSFQAAWIRS